MLFGSVTLDLASDVSCARKLNVVVISSELFSGIEMVKLFVNLSERDIVATLLELCFMLKGS